MFGIRCCPRFTSPLTFLCFTFLCFTRASFTSFYSGFIHIFHLQVDLFAFCEVGACQLMPPECREVSYGKPVPVAPGPGSCYYSILPPCELPASAQKYKFLFSLFFLADEARFVVVVVVGVVGGGCCCCCCCC